MDSHFTDSTDNINELKFSREQGFFDKSIGVKWLIGALFLVCLFVFLHFREVRVETLELNNIAPNYVVAQVDFDFFDEEASIILKQEAVRDIGRIYQIPDREIRQRKQEFEQSLLKNPQSKDSDEQQVSFEEAYRISELLERVLAQIRFTDPRTLQKMREVNLATQNYLIYTPRDLAEKVSLPDPIWEKIQSIYFPEDKFDRSATELVFNFFKNQEWNIQEDIPAQRNLRKRIQLNVPDKYTHVGSGSRIIDQGEKVTTRHIAMMQAMKNALRESRNLWHPLTLIGTLILSLLLTGISIAYLKMNYPFVLNSNRTLFLLVTLILLTMGFAKAIDFFLISSQRNISEFIRYPLIVPFAAILLTSLINAGVATFASGFLTLVLMLSLALDNAGFILLNFLTAIVAILSTKSLRQRKEIFVVCLKAWLCSVALIFSYHFYHNTLWSFTVLTDILSASTFMLLTAILSVGLLPLFESGFKIMTDVSLMEYMDPNNDLLRKLTIEAPGTYQHSVVVGNLAEAAALAIGANGLFCRVATLYHDIGKMSTSQYFTENQFGEMNIHQLLTPLESAQVIMAHVSEGVRLSRMYGIPEQIIDIIKEHHGTTLVYYFYRKQLEKVGGDPSLVDEKDFRYSGPKPRTKESAIIMIADSFEAASRSLEQINEDTLTELINRIVREKAEDGQFDECLITFEDLGIVKNVLVKTLLAAGHSRIKYPVRDQKAEKFVVES